MSSFEPGKLWGSMWKVSCIPEQSFLGKPASDNLLFCTSHFWGIGQFRAQQRVKVEIQIWQNHLKDLQTTQLKAITNGMLKESRKAWNVNGGFYGPNDLRGRFLLGLLCLWDTSRHEDIAFNHCVCGSETQKLWLIICGREGQSDV